MRHSVFMKPRFCSLLVAVAAIGVSHAEVPQKALLTKYQKLWQFSPFTAKPVGTTGPIYNPLEDYVLLGVSPIKEGYRVTLLNKKNPAEPRIVVETHRPAKGFKVLGVIRQKGNPRGTVVQLSREGSTGTIGFEEKFLTLTAPPAAAKQEDPQAVKTADASATSKQHIVPKIPRATFKQSATPNASPNGATPPNGTTPPKTAEGRGNRRGNR